MLGVRDKQIPSAFPVEAVPFGNKAGKMHRNEREGNARESVSHTGRDIYLGSDSCLTSVYLFYPITIKCRNAMDREGGG